uniref:(northern house mosquito) hypothetical protein n=1 Tax=Culex pipiens TaxID=7175 RepID=A0A8D8BG22_CULPI
MLQPVRLAQVKLSPDFRLVLQQPQPLRRRNRRKLGQVLADDRKLLEDGLAAAGGCGLDFAAAAPGRRSAAIDARIAVVLVGTIRPDERHRRKVEILHFEPSSPEPKRNYETPRLLFLLAKKKGRRNRPLAAAHYGRIKTSADPRHFRRNQKKNPSRTKNCDY